MYVGVDIGATKTLVGVLDNDGVITERTKFLTPEDYQTFLSELAKSIESFEVHDFAAGGVGLPTVDFDRRNGIARSFGNQNWKNIAIIRDMEQLFHCPFVAENDAKMAGLSEAMLQKDAYDKVLYVSIGTGIGYALIDQQIIDTNVGDGGGRMLVLEHKGKLTPWEDFASGRAIVARYGKETNEITDTEIWKTVSRELAQGLIELIAITEPEIIIFGGSVGSDFKRYAKQLQSALAHYHLPLIRIPVLAGASRPQDAVLYGCYDFARQVLNHA